MFCPECSTEYREGFLRCSDCDVDLVAVLPPEPARERQLAERGGDLRLMKVFETGDASQAALIESLLRDAAIVFDLRNLYARQARLGFGTIEFWVRQEDERAAREVLGGAELQEG